jgi:predicted glycoside hydrolase/deacetylase ChbG (UPF0249 family)
VHSGDRQRLPKLKTATLESVKKSLIVNADDFGYTHGVNAAIDRCAREGIVRSATIMANGPAFDEAVSIAKANEHLRIGVHLVLTELIPLCDPEHIPGLVDDQGFLPSTPERLWAALIRKKVSRRAIRHELNTQVTKVLDHGLAITHLDSHQHVHLLPQVLEAVCHIASRYSIPRVRNPFDQTPGAPLFARVDQQNRRVFCRQHLKARFVTGFRRSFFRCMEHFGLVTPDHFYGVSLTGVWNAASAIYLIAQLPPGLSEWMVHPGDCDSDLCRKHNRLIGQREKERDLLISPLLKRLLAMRRIELKSYGVLANAEMEA